MKNIFTKVLTGILAAVFVTAFGVSSVFADSGSNARAGQPVAAPATQQGKDICGGNCTGPEFDMEFQGIGNFAWGALKKTLSAPFRGWAGIIDIATGGSPESAGRKIGNIITPENNWPKDSWCVGGKYVPAVEIKEPVGGKVTVKYRCNGKFDRTAQFIDGLKDIDTILLKPLGLIIWAISKFFELIASFLTTFTGFALYHAFSFFSNDTVKEFIFKLWYGFANFTFAFYVIVMAIGSAQIVLGIDKDHASIKKFLPRVIGAIFITAFSFVFFLVMLDIGNILTSVIYGIASGGGVEFGNVVETLSRAMVPNGIENISDGIKMFPSNATLLFSGATVVLFTGLLLLSFLSLSFVLISRTVILVIVAILGPFAGLAYSIPGAESYTGKWAKTVAHHALLPAILAFFIGLAFQGANLITTFFQTTDLDQKLAAIASFSDGGIKLSNLLTVAWIGTCLYFGSTKAISTEYTEQAIGLAKNVGHRVQSFFQPALEKTALIAGVGGTAVGAFGGTAQGVMAFGGAYKGAGWAYNKTEAKILEVGKTALELTGTRAKLAAKKSIFGLNRPVSPTNDTRNPLQRTMSDWRDTWHANISGSAADIHAQAEASKNATEGNIARQRGNLLRNQGEDTLARAQTLAAGSDERAIMERQGNDLIMRGRNLQLAADAKESKSMAEKFEHASLEGKLRFFEEAQGASFYKAAELFEKDIEDLDLAQRERFFARMQREYERIRTTDNEADRRSAIEKMNDLHRSLRKKDINFNVRDDFLDRLADNDERRVIEITNGTYGRAMLSDRAGAVRAPTSRFAPIAAPTLFYNPQAAPDQIPENQITDVWSPDMQCAVTGRPNSLGETVTLRNDTIRKLIKKGDFRGNRGEVLLGEGILRGLYKDVFANIADTNTTFTNVAPAEASQINDIIQGIVGQSDTVRGQLRANSAGMRTINFHTPINLNVPGMAAPVVVNNMEELINAVLTAGPLTAPRGSPPRTVPTLPTATMTVPGITAI